MVAPSTLFLLDTCLLINLHRELRGAPGPATCWLEQTQGRFAINAVIAGEFAVGFSAQEQTRWRQSLAVFEALEISPAVAWAYGQIYRTLQAQGQLIATGDLWIAATAQANKATLVSRNQRDFQRIPDLHLVGY